MKLILEYVGQGLICVVAAGALLTLFLTGKNAQTREIGAIVKERQESDRSGMEELMVGAVKERGVEFSYEEECFQVDAPVEILQYFRAKKKDGRELKVKIEEIFPETYEKTGDKIIFRREGIYEVRVSAGGYLYEVCVPVVQYAD